MLTNIEFKAFMQKHETEILKNDWESVYNDLSWYLDVSNLTDFLLNKAHINPLFYMTAVPRNFARELDITSITIPSSVASIGMQAFLGCSKLTSITIPNSVTSIDMQAFADCDNLKEIKYTGNQQQWDKLLATSEEFANWICESRVKVNLL